MYSNGPRIPFVDSGSYVDRYDLPPALFFVMLVLN